MKSKEEERLAIVRHVRIIDWPVIYRPHASMPQGPKHAIAQQPAGNLTMEVGDDAPFDSPHATVSFSTLTMRLIRNEEMGTRLYASLMWLIRKEILYGSLINHLRGFLLVLKGSSRGRWRASVFRDLTIY